MSDLYTRLVSGFLFPMHEWFKGHETTRLLKQMEESQWWNPDQLRDIQLQRLRMLLAHAFKNVPYYRSLFLEKMSFEPGDLEYLSDLSVLPLLDKNTIRIKQDELRSVEATQLSRFNTGGSTGEPLIFYISRERISHDVAAKWRATRWWGVDIGDPEVVIWGSPIELKAQDRLRAVRDRIFRTQLLPAFSMAESELMRFVISIRRVRPAMLFGYPSALSLIARFARDNGHRLDDLGIKVVFVTSETLYPDQRQDMEEIFGCRVANGYGGRDSGFIAHECPHGRLHQTAEDIIVETVDEYGNPVPIGVPGEIVVTHLATKAYPFIRYRTGDIGVLSDECCPCGRSLPVLKELKGRTTDFLRAKDGTLMHGLALIYVLREMQGVKAFKIIQESLDLTRVLIVFDGDSVADVSGAIEEGFRKRLGSDVVVKVEFVSEIPPEKSGKYRYVISKIT